MTFEHVTWVVNALSPARRSSNIHFAMADRNAAREAARYRSTGNPRPRASTRRWTSLVPSPISRILASR